MDQKYKNRKYAVSINLPVDENAVVPVGERQSNSVTVVNLPFILKRISHGVLGGNHIGVADLVPTVFQDGQYTIEWRTDTHNYESEPLLACAWYGSDNDHFPLETPEELAPKTTITVYITNQIQRTAATTVQVIFHGLEPDVPTKFQGR
jgi:hypothetical protein